MLVNVTHHCDMVANVCSSTVFDFIIHDNPCIYFNYEQPQLKKGIRDIGQNYKYVHLRSMPTQEVVIWAHSKSEVKDAVSKLLDNKKETVEKAKNWYSIIVGKTPTQASQKIWTKIRKILK